MSNISNLPTEILFQIFTYLPRRQLARSRRVCVRWKTIIEHVTWSDWLRYARELRDEFSLSSKWDEDIKNLKVLDDGVIGVHKVGSITYYDIDTLQECSTRSTITDEIIYWRENSDNIVMIRFDELLEIIRKVVHKPNFKSNTIIYDYVTLFLLTDREVYYVSSHDPYPLNYNPVWQVFVIRLDDGNLSPNFIQNSPSEVLCLGYTDCLNLLTCDHKIYSLEEGKLILADVLEEGPNLLHQLHRFNLLQSVNWSGWYKYQHHMGHKVPYGLLKHTTVVKIYGDMVFVGSDKGVLRIYHKPYVKGVFNYYLSKPVKQYNFVKRSKRPKLRSYDSDRGIYQVDVVEVQHGYKVFVALREKIVVLNYASSVQFFLSAALKRRS